MPRTKPAAGQPTDKSDDVFVGGTNDPAIHQQLEVHALRRALEECQRQRQLLCDAEDVHRIILENVSDAVFLTDDHEAFTFICPNCNVIFG
jgi:hypothetical protein